MKAVIYTRVSSREQEREGFSIPAQVKLLEEYAHRHGFEVVETYCEAETAKQSGGRESFQAMLSYLKKEGKRADVKTLLVEKTDRLYRNFKDYILIEELDLEIHFVKEGEILNKDSRSHTKFIHGIKLLMAKNYIDNLSEEVKKGKLEKAEQGHYPNVAPYGYTNNKATRLIDVEPDESPLVQRAFTLYATGQYSLATLREQLYVEGYQFRNSQPKIGKSTLAGMLKNPFYIGDFVFREKYYKGKHAPLVTLAMFQACQDVADATNRPKAVKHQFAFSGLITCGVCGCSVTPQIQKSKYIYYHCSNGKGKCANKYLREETLADQFAEAIKRLSFSPEMIDTVIAILKESLQDKVEFHDTQLRALRARHDSLSKKIDQVYEDKLDKLIPEELWFRKHEQYKAEQTHIEASLSQHSKGNYDYIESGIQLLELAKNASGLYARRSALEKRRLLSIVLSNCTLKAGNLDYNYKRPFDLIVQLAEIEKISDWVDEFRTVLFQQHAQIQMLLQAA